MKKVSLIFVLMGLCIYAFTETYIAGGSVSGTWGTAGSPYFIQGNITIDAGATLTGVMC